MLIEPQAAIFDAHEIHPGGHDACLGVLRIGRKEQVSKLVRQRVPQDLAEVSPGSAREVFDSRDQHRHPKSKGIGHAESVQLGGLSGFSIEAERRLTRTTEARNCRAETSVRVSISAANPSASRQFR